MAGRFIVFEGIDSDVLADQVSRLSAWLLSDGLTVIRTREPTDGPIGTQIRLVLNDRLKVDELTLAALFLADRMDHLNRAQDGILLELERDRYVVCARYLLSAYAYQSEVASFEWLRQINQLCRWPNLMIFIDTPVERSLRQFVAREGYAPEVLEEHRARLVETRNNYLRVIEQCKSHGEQVIVVDGNQPAGTVHQTCRDLVVQLGL